jgi:hypothetical protein
VVAPTAIGKSKTTLSHGLWLQKSNSIRGVACDAHKRITLLAIVG